MASAGPIPGAARVSLASATGAEALGGSIEVGSPPGEGALILVQLPLRLH
jgi:signal transduction histidine kinase